MSRRTSRRPICALSMRRARSPVLAFIALVAAGCAGNIHLFRTLGSATGPLGPPYECRPGAARCAPGAAVDPARSNMHCTRHIPLPACPNGIEDIVIANVGGTPVATVQCAAPPNTPTGPGDNPLATDAGAPSP
jgi:hypothetical protein